MPNKEIMVIVNGTEFKVFSTDEAYFVPVTYGGKAKVKLLVDCKDISISPKRFEIPYEKIEGGFLFELPDNINLYITFDGLDLPLFLYGNKPEEYDNKATYYYKAGTVYEAGTICLKDNESVYIEAGAIVRGVIHSDDATNIKVYGQGILDNSFFSNNIKSIRFNRCKNVTINDIIIIRPTSWMVALFGCDNVHISGLKEIGEVISSDGIDIVGCSNVLVENCCLRNNDDCVVVKHKYIPENSKDGIDGKLLETSNIRVRHCLLYNAFAGNAIEIGHELQCDEVSDVIFSDIDIVRVGGGAPFSIHAGDRAAVRNILYENIYVEHYYDKLFDIRVMKSRFNRDKEYGSISGITFKNIYITDSIYNPGYSVSVIGGHDCDHMVSDVKFENVYINSVKLTDLDQIDLYTRYSEKLEVR